MASPVMCTSDTIPPKPLGHAEIERIRAHREVKAITTLGATSIHERRYDRTVSVTSAVMLVETTVYALEYDGSEWTQEILETDATRRDHLERALDRLERNAERNGSP